MPQPILTKYKQGDLGMPYPKKRDKKNLNLSHACLLVYEEFLSRF